MKPRGRVPRIVMWTAGVVLAVSVAGLLASALRPWWPLTPPGSWLDGQIVSGCLWMTNVREVVLDGSTGTAVVGMDDPHWWWPGDTGFVETSSLDEGASGDRLLWGLVLPLWMPAAVSGGLLLAFWRIAVLSRRRAMVGRCSRCGYDLAGIDGVCPECGSGQ